MSVLFSKFRDADIMGVRQYIEEGHHLLQVGPIKNDMTKNPMKASNIENFIAEFKVIRTKPLKDEQKDVLKENMTCSLVETSAQQGYAGNVVSFVAGVLGMTAREFQSDENSGNVLRAVCQEEQILAGMLVRCRAQKVDTKKTAQTGQQYTAKSWEPVPAREYAEYGLTPPEGTYDPDGFFEELSATGAHAAG
jgi:hypothetical protein